MWDMVDFTAQSTIITIENGTASTNFFIKCYTHHNRLDHYTFQYAPCFRSLYIQLALMPFFRITVIMVSLFEISGRVKQLVRARNALS